MSRDLHTEIQEFIDSSPWGYVFSDVPSTPVRAWGTLAWARLALELLRDNEHAYFAYQEAVDNRP